MYLNKLKIIKKQYHGTKIMSKLRYADQTQNQEYCCYCYKEGAFTADVTMDEMIGHNLEYLDEFNKDSEKKFTKEECRS